MALRVRAWRAFFRPWLTGVVAPTALLCLLASAASAQFASPFATNTSPLFQAVLTRPSDLNNTLQYAVSASAYDVESAIGAYEQLLFYNPTLSRVRFELGVLYYRLGSYEMARGYLKSALEQADITPDLRQRTEDLLYDVDKQLQVDRFSGFVQTGLAYQSNPGAGPGPGTVLASGNGFDSRFFRQSGWNWFGGFGLNYVHDFQNQRGDTFEASVVGYDQQEFRLHQFDVGVVELRAGPRFGITPNSEGAVSIKPYLLLTGTALADAIYSGSAGGGLTLHAVIGNVALDPYAEIARQGFHNSGFYPLASGMSGTLSTYAVRASGPLAAGLGWQTRLGFAHSSATFSPDSYDAYAADIWLPWNFSPLGDGRTWTLTPSFGVSQWQYSAPDPNIDPNTTPRVTEWRVGLGLDVPVWNRLYLSTLALYRRDNSNIPAFTTHDLLVQAGPTFKF